MAKPNELLKDSSKPDGNPERKSVASKLRIGPTPIPPTLMHWWTPILVGAILFSLSLTFSMFWGDTSKLNELLHLSIIPCLAVAILPLLVHQGRKLFRSQRSPQTENRPSKKIRKTNFSTAALYIPALIAVTIVIVTCGACIAVHNGAHWPSKDAMFLCTMISTAGSAFSTWQQRSYENQLRAEQNSRDEQRHQEEENRNERQHREDAKRNEFWHRREQAYRLLASPIVSSRIAGIALLTELADMTSGRTKVLDGESLLLQQHIIDILCVQMRREGLNIQTEGTAYEHSLIQRTIIEAILCRIDIKPNNPSYADWSSIDITLQDIMFITPISIHNKEFRCELNFNGSTFLREVEIQDSVFNNLRWERAKFLGKFEMSGTREISPGTENEEPASDSAVRHRHFPSEMRNAVFTNTLFQAIDDRRDVSVPFKPTTEKSVVHFRHCQFKHSVYILSGVDEKNEHRDKRTPELEFDYCSLESVYIGPAYLNSRIVIFHCAPVKTIDILGPFGKPAGKDASIIVSGCHFISSDNYTFRAPVTISEIPGDLISAGQNTAEIPLGKNRSLFCSITDDTFVPDSGGKYTCYYKCKSSTAYPWNDCPPSHNQEIL